MLFCKLTSPVTVNVCQVRNLYISETTIPITPNAPKLLLTTRFLTGNHTPKTNKMTDTIPIGLSRFIKPVISCTPFILKSHSLHERLILRSEHYFDFTISCGSCKDIFHCGLLQNISRIFYLFCHTCLFLDLIKMPLEKG